MGITKVTVKITNLAKSRKGFEDLFLVDTGAIHCLAPADKIRKAGIKPEGREVYELADGRPVEYDYGFARVAFMGAETVSQIIFGPANAEPILGVVALENVGIGVDPVTRSLKKMPALSLKSCPDADSGRQPKCQNLKAWGERVWGERVVTRKNKSTSKVMRKVMR